MYQLVLAIAVIVSAFLLLRRANELCVLRAERGRVRIVRGRIPQRLLDDVADVIARSEASSGELRLISEGGEPQLMIRGAIAPEINQRLRNVLGGWTVAQLRTAPRPRKRPR